MKRNKVIAVLLVFAVILCAMLVACNDKCTEHVDADGDLKCDNCGAEVTPSTDDGNTDGGNTDGGNTDGGNTDGGNTDGGNGGGNTVVTYTVNVKSIGGMPLENVLTYVWQGDEYMDYGKTNSNGQATISLPIASNYKVTLQSVPDGYVVNESGYSFTGRTANITLTSQVIPNPNNSLPSPYKLGDIMQDFTVTTSEGTTYTLSEELKTHDLVMINFWYTTCTYCVAEFPYMVEQYGAYQNGVDGALYSDDVSIIALNTYSEDNEDDVDLFKFNHGLNFDVAKADPAYFNAFPTEGYPTTVFVDRYGVICCIEIGGMTSTKPFKAAFDHFIGDDYEQKILTSIGELTPIPKPNITQAESSVIANAFVKEGSAFEVTFRPESDTADAEYAWPFIIGEKDGRTVLTTPIHDMDSSYAIIHMDIPLTAGQAIGMDYFCSSEISSDILYVLVNGEDILQISGESEAWQTCYPYVANEDGTYTVTLIFLKDSDQAYADKNTLDNIFVDNLHIVNNADQAGNITVPTYIPREAATHPDKYGLGFQNYITPVFNNEDGYYHVGSANGPLLLADMMGYSNFSATESVYTYAYNDKVIEGGVNYGPEIINYYCNYSSNAKINGFCTVNQRLRELLEIVARVNKNNEANTWLQFCSYYDAYGTEEELQDPIRGLAPFSAYDTILNATAGLDEFPNEVTYDRVVMPRGYWYAFTPTVSGAYRIESKSTQEVDGWIFQYDYDKNESIQLYEYDHYKRLVDVDDKNVEMYYYMEAGQTYYIDIAYYDVYAVGTFYFKVEYLGETEKIFRYASPGVFTTTTDENEQMTNTIIAGGVTAVYDQATDTWYANTVAPGNELYLDLSLPTGIFSQNLHTLIGRGAFDFSVDEDGNPVNGGVDYTATMLSYYAQIYVGEGAGGSTDSPYYTEDANIRGCVKVNAELATILQKLMDKYTFKNVVNSWTKLCYYYETIGPEA